MQPCKSVENSLPDGLNTVRSIRYAIMQSHHLRMWRLDIKKYRGETRSITYLDEICYDTHDSRNISWVDSSKECLSKASSNREQRIIPNTLLLSAKTLKIQVWTNVRIPRLSFLKIGFKIICFQLCRKSVTAMYKVRFHS